jgi:Family of unknown function (DUF5906)
MVATARKFATREEAFAFVLKSGPTPEAKAVAKKWFIDIDGASLKDEAAFLAPEIQPSVEKTPERGDLGVKLEAALVRQPRPQSSVLRIPRIAALTLAKPKQRAEPKVEPEPMPNNDGAEAPRIMLPAIVPPAQPPARSDWDEAIAAMNERHAIIDNVGGKTMIASWEPSSLDPSRMEVIFQTKESFLLRYSNRSVAFDVPDARGGTRRDTMPLGRWWLAHRLRRQHRGVTFLPGGLSEVNDCLNLWRGWGVEAMPGDWSLIRRHIVEVLAGGNAEFAEYIIRWVAWSIQNPAVPAEVALVLIGEKGAGKGTFVRCLERIFGAHAFEASMREHVIDKFNGHLQDCVLFIADEAYWGGDKRCVGRLQGMITEPTLSIERKGIDVVQVRNCLHVVMLGAWLDRPGWTT